MSTIAYRLWLWYGTPRYVRLYSIYSPESRCHKRMAITIPVVPELGLWKAENLVSVVSLVSLCYGIKLMLVLMVAGGVAGFLS
jgi:hypothetical protein